MNLGKLLVLVIFVSVFLSSVAFAADPTNSPVYPSNSMGVGASCAYAVYNNYRCAYDSGQFTIVRCLGVSLYAWAKITPSFSYNSYAQCSNTCKNPTSVGGTWSSSSCVEPYSKMTKAPSGNINAPYLTTITSTVSYPASMISQHKINFDIISPTGATLTKNPESCNGLQTCTDVDSYNTYPAGTIVNYFSEVSLFDGTYIRNPQTGSYSFTISSSTSTPPPGGTSSGGSITATPSSINVAAGATSTSTISGGTAPYVITAQPSGDIATASLISAQLRVTGVAQGITNVIVGDSSSPQKTVNIPITVNSAGTPPPGGTTTPSGASSGTSSSSGNCADTYPPGTCTPISGIVADGFFIQGLCPGPASTQCKVLDPPTNGCAPCTVFGTWCSSSTSGYCAYGSNSCISGYPNSISSASDCNSVPSNQQGSTTPGTPGTPGTGTTENPVPLVINPSNPAINQDFNMRFTFSFSLPPGSTVEFDLDTRRQATCSGSGVCTITTRVPIAAEYAISPTLIRGDGTRTQFVANPDKVTVGPSTGTVTPTSGKCCVASNGLTRSYRSIPGEITEDQCRNEGATPYSYACGNSQLQTVVCQSFCGAQFSTAGTCTTLTGINQQLASNQFRDVCRNGQLCQCGGATTNNLYTLACDEACLTPTTSTSLITPGVSASQTSFPVGQCTDTAGYQNLLLAYTIGQQGGTASATYMRQPITLRGPNNADGRGYYQCQQNEYCVCTYISINSMNINSPTTPTLPGTRVWDDPNDITDSAPTAPPNTRVCDLPGANATITATLNLTSGRTSNSIIQLIQAGDAVTIIGSVAKLSNTCKGYNYTCQQQQLVECKYDKYGLWTELNYDNCSTGLPENVHQQGHVVNPNYEMYVGIGLLVLSIWCGDSCREAGAACIADSIMRQMSCQSGRTAPPSNALSYYNMINSYTGNRNNQQTSCSYSGYTGTCSGITGLQTGAWFKSGQGCTAPNQCRITESGVTGCNSCNGYGGKWCQKDSGNAYCTEISDSCAAGYSQIPDCFGTTAPTSGTTPPASGSSGTPCSDCDNNYDMCTTGSDERAESCNADCDENNPEESCYDRCEGTHTSEYTNCESEWRRCLGSCNSGTGRVTSNPTFDITGQTASPPQSTTPPTTSSASRNNYGGYGAMACSVMPPAAAGCPSPQEWQDCFGVCGKTYNTAVAAAPTCQRGGPVLEATESTYTCGQGSCGGFDGKKVNIEIRDPNGATVITDTTTTGDDGAFSYTFTAPAADGQFIAIVSVPRD